MTKEQFNEFEKVQQVKYINMKLEEGYSLTKISKELGIGRSTITDRFRKINYIYCKNRNEYIHNDSVTDVDRAVRNIKVKEDITIKEIDDKCNNDSTTDVSLIEDKVVQSNLINLSNEYKTLIEMIELYKKNSNILNTQIVIDLETNDNTLTTLRVNTDVLRQFNEFVDEYKQYKKVDLVSMALKEYMSNHK
ncbi:MAG: hypothetical protein ACRDA3_00020 [Peptostreptococcaceae bacterium]